MTRRSQGWPAPAKINLFLHVVGRRADGYHLLQTLFQFLELADVIDFELFEEGPVRRATAIPGVSEDNDLVVRAGRALKAATGAPQGARISVDKRLPMGGGLGGGSSDAATVLVALNALWGTGLDTGELAALGLELGADVPVFVRGETAWAEGVGERLEACPQDETPLVVVTPDCAVETARVFQDPDLTRDTPPLKMHAFSLASAHNDCESVTRRLYPEVGRALDWLDGFAPARMSGTGASVFAFFDDLDEARAVAAKVPRPWSGCATRRLNRSPLLDRLAREQREDNAARHA
ncbi:MAG: 4-(cytidine 5'-diphospho)-2-C-methyl-D-erythritol kinase [Gammaproteobacteria bacterium]